MSRAVAGLQWGRYIFTYESLRVKLSQVVRCKQYLELSCMVQTIRLLYVNIQVTIFPIIETHNDIRRANINKLS